MVLYVFIIIVFPSLHSIMPAIHMYMCKLYSCSNFFIRKHSQHAKSKHISSNIPLYWTYCSGRNPVARRLHVHLWQSKHHHTQYPMLHLCILQHDPGWQRTHQSTWGLQYHRLWKRKV